MGLFQTSGPPWRLENRSIAAVKKVSMSQARGMGRINDNRRVAITWNMIKFALSGKSCIAGAEFVAQLSGKTRGRRDEIRFAQNQSWWDCSTLGAPDLAFAQRGG